MSFISSDIAAIAAAGALAGLLGWAIARDLCTSRIPNRLIVCGLIVGLALNTVAERGGGFFTVAQAGAPGIAAALLGAAAGLGILLPLYLLRVMGAGDVKLMMVIGTFLGPAGVAHAALLTLVAGGVIALAVAASKGVLAHAVNNVRFLLLESLVPGRNGRAPGMEPSLSSAGKVPYALAIASGTVAYVVMCRAQYSLF
jgi:prepilin peptidase CpaA